MNSVDDFGLFGWRSAQIQYRRDGGNGKCDGSDDVMGHSRVDISRLYQHPSLKQIEIAINKRNQLVQ